jgi:glutaredoxin
MPASQAEQADDQQYRSVAEIVNDAMSRVEEREKYEAGGEEGRVVPALVLGPQRYPPLSIWGPDQSLTMDDEYGEIAEFVDRRDRRDEFDGRAKYHRRKS